ncbi:MAG: hypothetical protein V3U87_16075 [Methylococcaceae bacterium]
MDTILEKEIQNLIDNKKGDTGRLEFILSSIKEDKEIYNTDQKFLISLLEKHSYDENILDHLHFFNQKNMPKKETVTTFADNIQESETNQDVIYNQKSKTPKNKINATILAVVLGIFGLGGIGHIYIGKIAKGFGILISMITISLVNVISFFLEPLAIIDITWEVPGPFSFIELIIVLLAFVGLGIFIWQIIDVRKLTKKYNDHFSKTQENLW